MTVNIQRRFDALMVKYVEKLENEEIFEAKIKQLKSKLSQSVEQLKLKTQNEVDASINRHCLDGARVIIKTLESKLSQSIEREGILKSEMIYFSKLSTVRLSTTMVSRRARQCLKQIEQKESDE